MQTVGVGLGCPLCCSSSIFYCLHVFGFVRTDLGYADGQGKRSDQKYLSLMRVEAYRSSAQVFDSTLINLYS